MAVISVGERKGRRGGGESTQGAQSHTRVYYVHTDGVGDHGDLVLAATGVPEYGQQHPTDLGAYVSGRTPREIGPGHWEVDIAYTTPDPGEPPPGSAEAQTLQLDPKISVGLVTVMKPLTSTAQETYDAANQVQPLLSTGFANAAGEPWDPPMLYRKSLPTLQITRFEPTFSGDIAMQFTDSVNDNEVTIAGFKLNARMGMMMGITTSGFEWQTFGGQRFIWFPVTYVIHIDWETFDIWALEQGTFFVDASDGDKRKAFLTDEGYPRGGLLTADGDENTDLTTPVFKQYTNTKRQEPWGGLRLPTSIIPASAGGPANPQFQPLEPVK